MPNFNYFHAANHCLTYHDINFVLGREVEYTIDYSFIVITAVVNGTGATDDQCKEGSKFD